MLKFICNDEGATAIEYALICALLVLAVAVTLPMVGVTLRDAYQSVVNSDAFGH